MKLIKLGFRGHVSWRESVLFSPVPLLLFPMVTMLMVSLGFPFGVTVGKWQMPLALLCVMLLSWFWKGWRAMFVFLLFLVVTSMYATLLMPIGTWSYIHYHYPTVFLLSDGWNPFFNCTHELLPVVDGAIGSMYVAYLVKTSHFFDAAWLKSTGNMLGGHVIGFLFVEAAFICAYRWAREVLCKKVNKRWIAVLFSAFVIFAILFWLHHFPFDLPLGAAFSILFFCLGMIIERRLTGTEKVVAVLATIACFSLRTNGLFVVFFIIAISITQIVRRGWIFVMNLRVVGYAIVVIAFSAILTVHPYITNWVAMGGPFYPLQTFNKDIPVYDLTADFKCNLDTDPDICKKMADLNWLQRMSIAVLPTRLGLRMNDLPPYANRTSTVPVQMPDDLIAFQERMLGYNLSYTKRTGTTPITGPEDWLKIYILLIIIAWIMFANSHIYGILFLSLMIFIPTTYVGYVRYIPHYFVLPFILTAELFIHPRGCRYCRYIALVLMLVVGVIFAVKTVESSRRAIGASSYHVLESNNSFLTDPEQPHAPTLYVKDKIETIYPCVAQEVKNWSTCRRLRKWVPLSFRLNWMRPWLKQSASCERR